MKKNFFISFGAIILLAVFLVIVGSTTHFDGARPWTFIVEVYNADNLSPISNAAASIIVANEEPFGAIESFEDSDMPAVCTTDIRGLCEITAKFNCYGNESIFRYEEFMNFRNRNLLITAQGFENYNAPLKTLIETPLEIKKDIDFQSSKSKIKILLKPLR